MSIVHRARSTALIGLTGAALIAPGAAHAMLPRDSGQSGPPSSVTVVRTADDGFDWGSAAIGAGGGASLVLLSAGALTLAGRRRIARVS
jgi:hypothetical protein